MTYCFRLCSLLINVALSFWKDTGAEAILVQSTVECIENSLVDGMTTKQDVEKWREGCDLAENGDFEAAEAVFLDMSDITARIYFNLASCATKQGKMYHVGKVR